jgi:DNA-binding NarL/FixJ family response regulator
MSDATSILIVDDEAPARSRLREVLADLSPEFPHRIVGEAARPQSVPYRQQMTILDVMIQAGGLTDFADDEIEISADLHEVLQAFRHFRRPGA